MVPNISGLGGGGGGGGVGVGSDFQCAANSTSSCCITLFLLVDNMLRIWPGSSSLVA